MRMARRWIGIPYPDYKNSVVEIETNDIRREPGKNFMKCSITVTKQDIQQALENILARGTQTSAGLPTGSKRLDRILEGMHKGQLIILAGHPGIGTTGLMLSIVGHMCLSNNIPTAVFTLDLSREQFLERILLSQARIDLCKARKGNLETSQLERLQQAATAMSGKPIYIDGTARLTPEELTAKAIDLRDKHGIECLIIDSLDKMLSRDSRLLHRELFADISEKVRDLALRLTVPVMMLCDLDFDLILSDEHRREPKLTDLGERLIIERYANVILLLDREKYYRLPDDNYEPNDRARIMIVKNDKGPKGEVGLRYNDKLSLFEELG